LQENFYYLHWTDSGFGKKVPYLTTKNNERILLNTKTGVSTDVKLIANVSDLQLAISKYSKGFIWIDDSTLPADVIAYAEENFKKELYLDHYEYDENPYSIWPGTLYSWGFDETIDLEPN